MSETACAYKFIYSRLRSRVALNDVALEPGVAAEDVKDCIVYRPYVHSPDVQIMHGASTHGDLIVAPMYFQVLAVCAGDDPGTAAEWSRQIYNALHQWQGSNDLGVIHTCTRDRADSYCLFGKDGVKRWYDGGIYKLVIGPSA